MSSSGARARIRMAALIQQTEVRANWDNCISAGYANFESGKSIICSLLGATYPHIIRGHSGALPGKNNSEHTHTLLGAMLNRKLCKTQKFTHARARTARMLFKYEFAYQMLRIFMYVRVQRRQRRRRRRTLLVRWCCCAQCTRPARTQPPPHIARMQNARGETNRAGALCGHI